MSEITLRQMADSVVREIGFRQRCYPKWVKENRMKQEEMSHEIASMRAILDMILRLEQQEFLTRTKLRILPLPLRSDDGVREYEVTGAFNGFTMECVTMPADELRELFAVHEASQALIEQLLAVKE